MVIVGGAAQALISVGGGPLKGFATGQAIGPNAVVESIAFDQVVIAAGQARQTLAFAEPKLAERPSAAQMLAAEAARDAIARVAYAEAGDQGDAGLAGVIYTILNRLKDGRWGTSVEAVINAPRQFEPVSRVGGDWRNLPAVSEAQRARVETILNLALEGHLPDLTRGARYFQNPQIVAQRARLGTVSPRLVDFGGAPPSAVIGGHSFYEARR